jgi:hypothetical protein
VWLTNGTNGGKEEIDAGSLENGFLKAISGFLS